MTTKLVTKYFVQVILFSLFLMVGHYVLLAQESTPTPAPTPENEELKKLKEENEILDQKKKKAESEKAIAEAEKAKLTAEFPKPTTTPLAGDTTLEGVKIESEMMTYQALTNAADKVAQDIKKNGDVSDVPKIAIFDNETIKTMTSYSITIQQLNLMKNEYDSILSRPHILRQFTNQNKITNLSPISTGIAAGQSILGSFIDLIALLRTDTKITGNQFTIEESAFASEVFRALRKQAIGSNVFYPIQFPPKLSGTQNYVILKKIQDLYAVKIRSEKLLIGIEELEKAYKEQTIAKETLESRLRQIDKDLRVFKVEEKKYDELYRRFPTSDNLEKWENKKQQIKDNEKERDNDIPKKLGKIELSLEAIAKQLVELYSQIRISIPQNEVAEEVVKNFTKIAQTSVKYLNRNFTNDELIILLDDGDDSLKQPFLEEAKKFLNRDLTKAEEQELLKPFPDIERDVMQNIIYELQSSAITEDILRELNYSAFLDDKEVLILLFKDDATASAVINAQSRNKSATVARLKGLNAQFDKFYNDLIKVDANTSINPITSYIKAENLKNALGCDVDKDLCNDVYFLALKVISAGGNNKVTKNLIRDVFAGPNIKHSGGVIVEYKLYTAEGLIKMANTFSVYEKYQKSKSIPKKTEKANEDKINQ